MTERPFNIVDYIPEVSVDFTNGSTWSLTGASSYQAVTLDGPDGFVYQSQLDIAGWTKEGLTAFFSNQYIQRDGPYTPTFAALNPLATLQARDYVIITDVPLQITPTMIHAGFMDNNSDYMAIKFGQASIHIQSTTTPTVMIAADSWMFGSGQPTASGTLYVTRICIPQPFPATAQDFITFPALRYVAQGVAMAEAEFVYLNRLRRSYELQQLT